MGSQQQQQQLNAQPEPEALAAARAFDDRDLESLGGSLREQMQAGSVSVPWATLSECGAEPYVLGCVHF